ncbi:MAG TPA: hypothetical protein VFL30_08580, partial [Rhodanobacteraceae bacterium]|nr:hypothetical protein [Rhodanobacteraceae bacterium]
MHHLDPQQLPPAAPRAQPRKSSLTKWAIGAAVAVLGTGAGLSYLAPGESGDRVSNAQALQMQQQFAAHGAVSLELVPSDELDSAVNAMQLSQVESAALKSRVAPGIHGQAVRLARITLWDSMSQDGDVIEVSSAGYQRAVQLMNAPVQLVIPVDSSSAAEITGVRDGGGGITLGVLSGAAGV